MHRLRFTALAALAVIALSSTPAWAGYTFLGWDPTGSFWFQQVKPPAVQVCREDTSDVPQGWPDGTQIGPGALCGDMAETVGGKKAVDVAKKTTHGVKFDRKNPWGLAVKLEAKDGKTDVVLQNGADKKETIGTLTSDKPLHVDTTYWRADGKSVVVVLNGGAFQVHGNAATILVGGPAGRRLAQKLNDDGMKLYRKKDWSGSGKLFEDAIAADPDWAPARYARAAAEAQGGVGRTAMIENLQWLKEHADKDKEAKRLLDKARSDGAFDAWIGDPEVRELVGMPKVSSMDVPARLLERDGTWTAPGATCKSPWFTLQFKRGGAAVLTVADSCRGKKTKKTSAATYKQTPAGPFQLELKKPIDSLTLPAKSTIVLDGSYQQLKLVPDGGGDPWGGTFEPGAARLDDSTL